MSTSKKVPARVVKSLCLFFSTAIATSLVISSQVVAQVNDRADYYEIPAQPLEDSLNAFARQADVEVLYTSDDVRAIEAPAISGAASREQAIAQLLAGTGLTFSFTEAGTLVVRVPEKTSTNTSPRSGRLEMAQVTQPRSATAASVSQDSATGRASEDERGGDIEEMVVTGSNIRGTGFGASPAFVLDRAYIDRTGFSTIEQLIDSIPQNFGGGVGLDVVSSPDRESGFNRAAGSSVNLRGLGSGSTLVLLNGRRLAPSGQNGGFVDISLIPLSAIERVEVLTDGASAIHGSDAIGGVVNFITRSSFDGAETSLRYGAVTEGGLDEYKVSQTFGKAWETGSAFISYEYFNRDNLGSEERGFSSDVSDADLLPGEERHSVFVSASQNIGERINVFADALYSSRDSDIRENFTAPAFRTSNTEQFNASVGGAIQLTDSWILDVVGNYSRNDLGFEVEANTSGSGLADSELVSVDVKADGSLFELPGGPIKLAVGGSYRSESFRFENRRRDRVDVDLDRDVYAAFGELFIPIFSDDNRRPGLERLELVIAGRFEDYSDFGSTARPKVGVLWSPVGDLSLRGTYSSSFKAPDLAALSETSAGVSLLVAPDLASPTGSSLVLNRFGNNAGLGPEEAKSWTAGLDFEPEALPGLSVKLTYYDIAFEERITRGFSSIFAPLLNPDVFAAVITRDPSPSEVASLVAEAEARGTFFNFGGPGFTPLVPFDSADVDVLLDQRLRNLSRADVNGVEFDIAYGFEADFGELNFGLRGDYIFSVESTIRPTEPSFDVVDTLFNPADLRLRGSASWSRGGINITTFVNYTDGYTDDMSSPEAPVDSWTTVDLQLSYDTQDSFNARWLNNIRISISALNIFDQDPPFVESNPSLLFSFDPTNSSPLGRFVAFQIEKAW